jgi:hypothetical protein
MLASFPPNITSENSRPSNGRLRLLFRRVERLMDLHISWEINVNSAVCKCSLKYSRWRQTGYLGMTTCESWLL